MKAAVLVPFNHEHVIMVHKACREGYPWSCDAAFPGGRIKKGESIIEAALREAAEEVCLDPSIVLVKSILPPETPLNEPFLRVYPVLGFLRGRTSLRVCSPEIDSIVKVSWDKICRYELREWMHPKRKIVVKGLPVGDGVVVWGMTLRIVKKIRGLLCRYMVAGRY